MWRAGTDSQVKIWQVINVATFKAIVTHTNGTETPQYYVVKDIEAMDITSAFDAAIHRFFDVYNTHIVKKVAIEQYVDWRSRR